MEKIRRICLGMIAGIGTVIFLFLTYFGWRYTINMSIENESLIMTADSGWKQLLFLAGALIVGAVLCKCGGYLKKRTAHVIAAVLSAVVTAGLFLLLKDAHAYAISDQGQIYLAAVDMLSGDFKAMQPGEYLSVYPFQLGLASIYTGIFSITKSSSFEVLQMVQAVGTGLTVYAGFRITRELFCSVQAQCIYMLCVLGCLPMYLYTLFIYGETFGICGAMYGIWFFLRANREGTGSRTAVVFWLLAGVAMTLAYIVRSALIIVWIAMAIIQVLIFLKNRKILLLAMAVISLFIMLTGQRILITSVQGMAGTRLDGGMPVSLWIAMGLQDNDLDDNRPGSYNGYSLALFEECEYDRELSGDYAKQDIIERFRNWFRQPDKMMAFFRLKLLNQWIEPTYGSFTMTHYLNEPEEWVTEIYFGETGNRLKGFLNGYQNLVWFTVLGYFLLLLRGKERTLCWLPGLILIGGFLFSVIWEAKSRYVYPYAVIALPYMAGSLALWCGSLKSLMVKAVNRIIINFSRVNM